MNDLDNYRKARVTVVGKTGKVTWLGHEWRLPMDSGKTFDVDFEGTSLPLTMKAESPEVKFIRDGSPSYPLTTAVGPIMYGYNDPVPNGSFTFEGRTYSWEFIKYEGGDECQKTIL